MTAPAPLGLNVKNNHIAKRAPSRLTSPALRMVGTAEPRTGGAVSLVSCTGGWPSRSLRIFIGPMRTVVPLTASIFAMPMLLFQTATIASAFVWAFIMLTPGAGLTVSTK